MSHNKKLNLRKYMEYAIKVMKDSINESRKDGKVSPKVGAVILMPDGKVDTSCRGEIRLGEHAEFTLIDKKKWNVKLDSSVLFTTLEPCAPGSRRHPKLGCAERIVNARITEVWVGIEDPDPTVDRKGIKYLQDSGITVHMFDRDFQEIIRIENKDFIEQALERAETAMRERKPKRVTLSMLEHTLPDTVIQDFSTQALKQYRSYAKIEDVINSPSFNRKLLQQGFLKKEADRLTPTGFGFLLFAKEPRIVIHEAGLLGTIHYSDGKEETRDFDGPMVLIPGLVEKWLHDKLPNVIDRSEMKRKSLPPVPFEMIREAVVNALIHRNYEITGAKCQLIVNIDTITVMSPGSPPLPVTLEQLQSFNAPMLSRNPGLHYVFARMEMAEERGLGIKSLKTFAEKQNLPLPRYAFKNPYLFLTLFRSPESAIRDLSKEVIDNLNQDDKKTWQYITSKETITSSDLITQLGFDERKTQRILKKLIELRLLRRVGKGPATRYEVDQP